MLNIESCTRAAQGAGLSEGLHMFRLKDSFKTCDDNLQPYTMRAERHTEILDLHSGVDERGFSFRSVGNRYIFSAS